jgi:ABC-type Fe3+/spermidine/putrescine transport system ATPase subunit
LGLGNLIPAQALPDGRLKSEIGEITFSEPQPFQPGQDLVLLLRPEDAIFNQSGDEHLSQLEAIVQDAVFIGEAYRLEVRVGETTLLVQSPRAVRVGEKINIGWPESKVQCLSN